MKFSRIISVFSAFVLFISVFGITANATGIGACTHASHGRDMDKTIMAACDTSITWMRDEISWNHVEKVNGELQLPEYTVWVDRANEQGIKPLLIFSFFL